MYHYHIQHILYNIECRERLRNEERRRQRNLTPEQRQAEAEEQRLLRERVQPFIDDEAEESDTYSSDEDGDTSAEVGLSSVFSHDEYVDSRGKPLVKVRGKTGRLFKIRSKEYYLYKKSDRRRILHRALRCHKIKATLNS